MRCKWWRLVWKISSFVMFMLWTRGCQPPIRQDGNRFCKTWHYKNISSQSVGLIDKTGNDDFILRIFVYFRILIQLLAAHPMAINSANKSNFAEYGIAYWIIQILIIINEYHSRVAGNEIQALCADEYGWLRQKAAYSMW